MVNRENDNYVACSSSFDYFKLGLGANPLRCDCDIRWLYSLLRATDSFRLRALPWTCDTGRRFAALSDADDFASCSPQQPNCSVITPQPDPDNSGNSTDTGQLPLVLQVSLLYIAENFVVIHYHHHHHHRQHHHHHFSHLAPLVAYIRIAACLVPASGASSALRLGDDTSFFTVASQEVPVSSSSWQLPIIPRICNNYYRPILII